MLTEVMGLETMISTGAGMLRGVDEGGATIFRGIPYVAPPVGDLRWRPPQAVAPWRGIRDATTFGPSCPQVLDSPIMMVSALTSTSEDCLTLNVWAPRDRAGGSHPVMVCTPRSSLEQGGRSAAVLGRER
jgi:para-nitrobenzyl esterase